MGEAQSLYVVLTANGTQYKAVLDDASRDMRRFGNDVDQTGQKLDAQGSVLDRYSTRVGLLGKAVMAIAPAFPGVAAAAVPALAATANILGVASTAAGVTAIAFHGVGDALEALQKAQLEPTAENLAEVKRQLADLSPQAADFVLQIHDLIPALKDVRDVAAAGLFPGASEAVADLDDALPRLERFASTYADVIGDLLAGGAEDLTSGRWSEFVDFLEGEARPTLTSLGGVVGDVAHGLTELWMAMDPASDGILEGLANGAEVFDKWASGLEGSEGLEKFLAYVQETGPEVVDTAMALAEAVIAIGQAAAPLTGPVLDGIQALATAVETVASTPIGGALVGFAATSSIASLAKQGISSAVASPAGQSVSETISNVQELAAAFKGSAEAEQESAEASAANADEKASLSDQVSEAAEKAGELTGANEQAADSDRKATAATAKNTQAQQSRAAALRQSAAALGKQAALLGGVMLASTGAADSMGLASTASMALTGALMGGGVGAAAGGLVGLTMDIANANKAWSQSLDGVNDAIESGNIDAMTARLEELKAQVDDAQDVTGLGDFLKSGLAGIGESFSFTGALITGDADKWQNHMSRTTEATRLLESAIQREKRTAEDAAAAQLGLSTAVLRTGREAGYTTSELLAMAAATSQSVQVAWAAYDAQTRLGQAIDDVAAAADKGKRGLDAGTEEGRENRTALAALAGAWADTKEAMEANGASSTKIERRYREVRKELIRAATEMGATRKEAIRLADQLAEPMAVTIRANHRETVASIRETFAQLQRDIEGNPIVQRITVRRDGTQVRSDDVGLTEEDLLFGAPGKRNADGGFYAYANGGLRFADGRYAGGGDGTLYAFAGGGYGTDGRYYDRSSRIVAGGANILWGELETGWEAYISGKPGQEARNREIWAEAGRRLGFDVSPRGHARPAAAASGTSTVVVQSAMPESLELVVDGQRFTAYVRGHAADVSERQLAAASRNGESTGRMDWS